jgi:HK97 family phage portal protein
MPFAFLRKAAPPPARPEAARPPLNRFASTPGWARGAGRSYDQLVRAGYIDNPVARAAVIHIAKEVASGVIAVRPGDHPAAALLKAPATDQGGPELIEAVASFYALHGNAFIEVACGDDGMPAALYALRPERVTIEPGRDGWPSGYVYRGGDSTRRLPAFLPNGAPGLLHIRSFHPLDDHYGLGGLSAAASAIETHNAAARWAGALLDNAARPSGALVYDPGEPGATLSAEQYERLKAEMESGFQGAANAGRPMLLEGGLRWQPLALTPAEMDFAATRAQAAREIAMAFGLPPLVLGLPGDATYSNYAEAQRVAWRTTILPIAEQIAAALEAHLKAWWPELTIAAERDRVLVLAPDRVQQWAMIGGADFLTNEEKRAMLGIGDEQ